MYNPERMRPTEASFAPIQREAMDIINTEFIVYVNELVKEKAGLKSTPERMALDAKLKIAGQFVHNNLVDLAYEKAGRIKIERKEAGGQQ